MIDTYMIPVPIKVLNKQIDATSKAISDALVILTSLEQTLLDIKVVDPDESSREFKQYESAIRDQANTLTRLSMERQQALSQLIRLKARG